MARRFHEGPVSQTLDVHSCETLIVDTGYEHPRGPFNTRIGHRLKNHRLWTLLRL